MTCSGRRGRRTCGRGSMSKHQREWRQRSSSKPRRHSMKSDFSRDSFDPRKQFLRVLMQQGRVLLDSDFNEQVSILLHYMQTLTEDLVGPYGGPAHRCGFEVTLARGTNNFYIGPGNYYVDGILCQNEEEVSYTAQPYTELEELRDRRYLIYLEVWERHVTAVEDDSIREEALRGADTATRSQVAWQVKALGYDEEPRKQEAQRLGETLADMLDTQDDPILLTNKAYELLKERRIDPQKERAKMALPLPNAGYRGTENQLYRVEVHEGGTHEDRVPKVKWAR